jgi:hypothetical protein
LAGLTATTRHQQEEDMTATSDTEPVEGRPTLGLAGKIGAGLAVPIAFAFALR